MGRLVQHDPEPEAVHRHVEPARRRDYVPVEEEDLTRLSRLSSGCLVGDERTRVVLAEDTSGEKAQEQPHLGRERRPSEGPREVARARRGTLDNRLQERPEALDVEVDPLCPISYPHGVFGRRQSYTRELCERP